MYIINIYFIVCMFGFFINYFNLIFKVVINLNINKLKNLGYGLFSGYFLNK